MTASPAAPVVGMIHPEGLAEQAVAALLAQGKTVASCESLTAGLVCARLADVPGASRVLRGGLVTYATDLKGALAGVSEERLAEYGPVDGVVASQMAEGAARACGADIGLATTGVAGPDAVGEHAPGTVWVAVTGQEPVLLRLAGSREEIRRETVERLLALLLKALGDDDGAAIH